MNRGNQTAWRLYVSVPFLLLSNLVKKMSNFHRFTNKPPMKGHHARKNNYRGSVRYPIYAPNLANQRRITWYRLRDANTYRDRGHNPTGHSQLRQLFSFFDYENICTRSRINLLGHFGWCFAMWYDAHDNTLAVTNPKDHFFLIDGIHRVTFGLGAGTVYVPDQHHSTWQRTGYKTPFLLPFCFLTRIH